MNTIVFVPQLLLNFLTQIHKKMYIEMVITLYVLHTTGVRHALICGIFVICKFLTVFTQIGKIDGDMNAHEDRAHFKLWSYTYIQFISIYGGFLYI